MCNEGDLYQLKGREILKHPTYKGKVKKRRGVRISKVLAYLTEKPRGGIESEEKPTEKRRVDCGIL